MPRSLLPLVVGLLLLGPAAAAPRPKPAAPDTFLVAEGTELRLLGPDGAEKERLSPSTSNPALSPDGRWLACVEFDRDPGRCALVLRPRGQAAEAVTVPLLWDQPGRSGSLPAWAAERETLLVTCAADGRDRKTVTTRKYAPSARGNGRAGVVIF